MNQCYSNSRGTSVSSQEHVIGRSTSWYGLNRSFRS